MRTLSKVKLPDGTTQVQVELDGQTKIDVEKVVSRAAAWVKGFRLKSLGVRKGVTGLGWELVIEAPGDETMFIIEPFVLTLRFPFSKATPP